MSKKKLLNERTIRRFGGLAGIKPISTSHFLSEMGEMPAYARDDEEEELEVEDDLGGEELELGDEELEIEDEEELGLEEPAGGGAEDLVVSLLDKVKEWATDQGVEMDVEGEGEIDHDALGGEEDLDMDMELGGEEDLELGDEEDELDMDMGDEEETLEEMINSILSEEDEEELEEGENPFGGDKGDDPKSKKDYEKNESRRRTKRTKANESRRRTKPARVKQVRRTKRAKSRGVKVKVLSDEKVIQEVTKRVKNRLARIAKAQKRRS